MTNMAMTCRGVCFLAAAILTTACSPSDSASDGSGGSSSSGLNGFSSGAGAGGPAGQVYANTGDALYLFEPFSQSLSLIGKFDCVDVGTLASTQWGMGDIAVNADGTVTLQEGSTDIGGTRASIAMQAAEVLTLPYEKVRPTVVDTDTIGFTAVTGGSRTTFATGWAAYEAAQDVRTKMIDRAAQIWEVDADTVELEDAVFKSKSDPELNMTFAELAGQLGRTGGGITGTAAVSPSGVGGAFAGNMVDVEVDPETGKTKILRFTVVQDAGKAIHPSYVEGQMQGGAVQGIGWALNEEYYMSDSGTMDNVSLLDYRMPTSLDLPMIDTVIVEVANPGHPYGVRGVGEAPIIPPTPAIANAIENAIGTRLFALPMNPAAVAKAVMDR